MRFSLVFAALAGLTSCGRGPEIGSSLETHFNTQLETQLGSLAPPNAGFSDYLTGVEFYQNILKQFPATGEAPRPELLHIDWPLAATKHMLLTRYGTPTIVVTAATEKAPSQKLAFLHGALDITRDSTEDPEDVHAPVTGTAQIVSFRGATPPFDYDAAVVIRDDESGLLVSLLHVGANQDLFKGATTVHVERGTKIGHLAEMWPVIPSLEARYRHTHLGVIDTEAKKLINPELFMEGYADVTPPSLKSGYMLDAKGVRQDHLVSGAAQLVVEAYDRDDLSAPNFEVSTLGVVASDQDGREIYRLDTCSLDAFAEEEMGGHTHLFEFIDFGDALGQSQAGLFVGGGSSDSGNNDRTFRYIVSHLTSGTDGQCATAPSASLAIDDSITSLHVDVALGDMMGNQLLSSFELTRE